MEQSSSEWAVPARPTVDYAGCISCFRRYDIEKDVVVFWGSIGLGGYYVSSVEKRYTTISLATIGTSMKSFRKIVPNDALFPPADRIQ